MGSHSGWIFACGGWIKCGNREINDSWGEELINDASISALFRESFALWFLNVNLVWSYCTNQRWEII